MTAPTEPAPAPKKRGHTTPVWEQKIRERAKNHLRTHQKLAEALLERDANEGDTRLLINDVLTDMLGYNKHEDLTTEFMVRGDYADYGVRLDGKLVAFIEAKRVKTELNRRHLRQVEMYGVNEGVEWLILTNARQWHLYRLVPGMPVSVDLVMEVDLLGDLPPAKKAERLSLISREAFLKGKPDEAWRVTSATAPERLLEVVLSAPVLDAARRELKRQAGHTIDAGDLGRLIRDNLIRPELLK